MKSCTVAVIISLLLLCGGGSFAFGSAAHDTGATAVEKGEVLVHAQSAHPATPQVDGHAATAEHDVHAAAEGHDEVHHADSLSPQKLKDLFWRTINFFALLFLLVKFLGKPIVSGLSGRQQEIREELRDLEEKRDAAKTEYKEFESRLAGMEQEMEQVVKKAVAQAENEKVRILQDAEKAADDIKAQAQAAIQAEMEDAKRVLREEVADQAATMAEEIIVKNLTPADQVTITEQFLERVGAVQ